MLSLTVREGDYVTIGDDIVVQVLKAGEIFRLAIDAPRDVPIQRAKLREQEGGVPPCIQRVRAHKAPPRSPGFKRAAPPAEGPV